MSLDRVRAENTPTHSGGDIEEATPDPFPNSEVKLLGADGTARETWWESRTPPGTFCSPYNASCTGFFLLSFVLPDPGRRGSAHRLGLRALERPVRLSGARWSCACRRLSAPAGIHCPDRLVLAVDSPLSRGPVLGGRDTAIMRSFRGKSSQPAGSCPRAGAGGREQNVAGLFSPGRALLR